MLSKLLTLLSTAKGAAAATVIAGAAVAGGVTATNPDVQQALGSAVDNVTHVGQPPVVAARNDADKKLRDAFQNDQKTLEKLHSTKVEGADRQKLDDTVNTADAALRCIVFSDAGVAAGATVAGRRWPMANRAARVL